MSARLLLAETVSNPTSVSRISCARSNPLIPFICASAFSRPPEAAPEQHEHREHFQPPDQHGEGAQPFRTLGQARIVAGGPDLGAERGADIAKYGGRARERRHEIDIEGGERQGKPGEGER